jgi:hypothetical protein
MNNKIGLMGCILLLLCLIFCAIPHIQANPSLYVSQYSINPEVLHPGDTGLLSITITNGETTATNTDINYDNSLPVDQTTDSIGAVIENVYVSPDGDGSYVVKASERYKNPVEIAPGSSITFDFTIKAEPNISSGIYTPVVNIDLESDFYHDVKVPVTIKVNNDTIDLIPQDFPSSISTIGETDISFIFINNRENDITNVMITPNESEHSVLTPSKQYIPTLAGLETETIYFSLIPKSTGKCNLSFNCTYKNGDNTHKRSFYFPINLSSFYEVYPIIYSSPETIKTGETKEIRLKIYNAKNEEINGVRIKPITKARISPDEYFIGQMDADDLYAVTFDISSGHLSANQSYPIAYEITFKQNNNIYTNTPVSSSITILPALKSNGIEYAIGIIILIIVLITIFIIFYLRKKRGRA